MAKKAFLTVISIVLVFCLAVLFMSARLWSGTQTEFHEISDEITDARPAFDAEILIGSALFDPEKIGSTDPAYFLARDALQFETSDAYLHRHLKTFILAKRLNWSFDDEDVLISWLSTVYLGSGEYGIETAAESLFGKNVDEMTKPESIAIAALIIAPSIYRNDQQRWDLKQEALLKKVSSYPPDQN